MGVGGRPHASATLPPGMIRYLLHRRLMGPRTGLDMCGKSRLPPGFDPLTIQLVASCNADCAIPAHITLHIIPRNVYSI